ncbi:low affinity immunoglobulin gamma Fc region receptor II-like [Pempheris klunzingeri]|uniref:low affinity immunoglobulin gamma Fc region receptor II-like n=1 Tax=Pempheris klunzingeri TaxID=3127111 RepID=UPI0039807402
MKVPAFSLLLGLPVLLLGWTDSAVFLNVSPDQRLFLRRDSVSLSCVDDGLTVDGWTVKRTTRGQTQSCDGDQQAFGMMHGSSCIIQRLFPADSGVYWCESNAGQRSAQVNVNVSDRSIILEMPQLPVIVGSKVTLHCKTKSASPQTVYFFRNDSFLGTGQAGEFTISDVQSSHEGFYWCSSGLLSESSKSWLSVRDPPPPDTPSLSLVKLLCHLVAICPYCITTILMVSIYYSKRKGVSMETDPRVEHSQRMDEEYDDITANVTTEHDF